MKMPVHTTQYSEPASASTWTDWAEATPEQREHFKVAEFHRAWSRTCTKCGEGDLVQRKRVPTANYAALAGQGFPKQPLPALADNARHAKFRTPESRIHRC